VTVAGAVIGPRAFVISGSLGDGHTVDVEVRFHNGRYSCQQVTVSTRRGAGPVTADLLRKVSVESLVREGISVAQRNRGDVVGSKPDVSLGPIDENLAATALIYRSAYAVGDDPTQRVADTLGLARRTAARWVRKARDNEYLGETDERKAGV